MEKLWRIKNNELSETVTKLQTELSVDKFVASLLVQRSITTYEQAKSFFRPSLTALHNPFLMKDMDLAVTRLNLAIQNNERILIYGDYDVDGTTSVALVFSFLRELHNNIDYYIPDRYLEGYGISFKGIDYAKQTNCTLIIALDCGIKAIDKVNYANDLQIDFIICDHHTAGNEIPKAIAVLDPKRPDCSYPFKELSGCGVGFKLLQAFSIQNNIVPEKLYNFIDLVAVSIASDIVSVSGENRILAYHGIEKLNTNPLTGLKAMMKLTKIDDKKIEISDSVFILGPRINAAGRIKSARAAVELLITNNLNDAEEFSKEIDAHNSTRKNLDKSITQEALEQIQLTEQNNPKKATIVYNPAWHKGVVGIVASRLIESFYRPTVVLTKSGDKLAGSARSVDGFNLYNAVEACSHLLEGFGGHMYAAGLNMKEEKLSEFKKCFENYVAATITPEQQIPKIDIDLQLNFSAITPKFYRIMKQFAPFGPDNNMPVFCTRNVTDTGNSRIVGQTMEHLKLELMDEDGFVFSGIAFSMAGFYPDIASGKKFDICFTIDENQFRGNVTLQLLIKDIKI